METKCFNIFYFVSNNCCKWTILSLLPKNVYNSQTLAQNCSDFCPISISEFFEALRIWAKPYIMRWVHCHWSLIPQFTQRKIGTHDVVAMIFVWHWRLSQPLRMPPRKTSLLFHLTHINKGYDAPTLKNHQSQSLYR